MTNEIQTSNQDIFSDIQKFELAQRAATALSKSTMVPEHFRGNLGNCMIALNFAARTGLDVFMVMQKMYVIKGKPGIEAQLAIALVNKSGRFSDLDYEFNQDKTGCRAYAKNMDGKICYGPWITMEMAKKEGWLGKAGSKWQTMPEVMICYRAAMFFARKYCPEALMGMYSTDEIKSFDTQPVNVTPVSDIEQKLLEESHLPDMTIDQLRAQCEKYGADLIDNVLLENNMEYPNDIESWNILAKLLGDSV